MSRMAYMAVSTLAGTPAVAALGGIPSEHVSTLGLVAGLVGVVSAGIAWVDSRVDRAIKRHQELDEERHKSVLRELEQLRDMLDGLRG